MTNAKTNRAVQALAEAAPRQLTHLNQMIEIARDSGQTSVSTKTFGRPLDCVIEKLLDDGFDVKIISHPLNEDAVKISWLNAKEGRRGVLTE